MTIITTRLISIQLSDVPERLSPHSGDIKKLKRQVNKLEQANLAALKKLTLRSHNKKSKPSRWTIIAHDQSRDVFYNSDNRRMKRIAQYIKKNNWNEPASIQFPLHRITGPFTAAVDRKEYSLYLVVKNKNMHWSTYLKELSPSIHITIAILFSLIICWLLARSFSKPITQIKLASMQIGNGELSSRVNDATLRNDELGQLARSFNAMAEKLERNIYAQQRLLADVSHELRTPLTRLQVAVGLAQQDNISTEKLNQYLARCDLEVGRLDQMIADVLTLSRLESNVKSAHFKTTELNRFISQIVNDCQFSANEKRITINFNRMNTCQVVIDKKLFNSAISNIINNAIKYSPEQEQVTVELKQHSDEVSVIITDNGDGIPISELEHIFIPFYRINQPREHNIKGTGLGLAIAKQAIDLHHGEIIASNAQQGGLMVEIKLPIQT